VLPSRYTRTAFTAEYLYYLPGAWDVLPCLCDLAVRDLPSYLTKRKSKHNGHDIGEWNMKHALLIDDEPEICLLLSNMLRRAGAECVLAHSVKEGRDALTKSHFDVVFLDVHLPDGLGYELVPFIKSISPGTRAIAISALDTEGPRALDAGADLFIPKPFDGATILSSIRDLDLRV
jgi:two-component system OmpR family response regulator